MSLYNVDVSGIAPSTTKDNLNDFFTFCGKISSIDYDEKSHKATIAFEKPNAAKTALMLNGGALDGATLAVTSDVVHQDVNAATDSPHIDQSDKPRSGIAAEYLAKGYVLSDHILEKAIDMDKKQGISQRFLNYIHAIDKTLGDKTLGPEQTISAKLQSTVGDATQRARAIDEQKGFTKLASDYYLKALSSPLGQKVAAFYTDTSKQIQDIHDEARRIADQEKNATTEASTPGTAPQQTPAQPVN